MSPADGPCDGVLLIGFGGPTSSAEIRPYLDRVLSPVTVPPERYEEVVRHYEALGGHSPYNKLAARQVDALGESLRACRIEVPVALGLRHMPPYIEGALAAMAERGSRRVLAFPLAAHRCEASWQRYLDDVAQARRKIGALAPAVDYPRPWHVHPLFVEALADRAQSALARFGRADRERARLIFTAHSIPLKMAACSAYVGQLEQTARLVCGRLGNRQWSLAFQSRSGSPHERWLEPDIGDVLREMGGGPALVVPLGFLHDHVEVLYDLDVKAARIARQAGVRMERATTVGVHPAFIRMMTVIARERIGR